MTHPHDTAPAPDPRVSVHGEAHLEVEPELARIGVVVTARGTDRRHTLDDLTRRNSRCLELLRGYGDAVESIESGALHVAPELGKGRGERVRAHHGSVRINATVTDFSVLGELTTRLGDLELTRVDGPWWSLRPDSPAHSRVRRQAVHEAVRRAREYAEALGSRLLTLTELSDPGAETPYAPRAAGFAPAPAGAARGLAAEPAPLDLEPQRQTVHARVTARFTMTPPDLGAPAGQQPG
ncbi:hypothetical protein GCM10010406_12030 [Streptomyces thermolineatus]|uniref:SIMPL domain-containing protein n=1 Tax=Streptomyces thermolineatus TaxID=44033 RepID=A0ABN3L7V7_9ACTN